MSGCPKCGTQRIKKRKGIMTCKHCGSLKPPAERNDV